MDTIKHYGDVTKISGSEVEAVDVVTFGAPCQDLSQAGKRAGMKHKDHGDDETTRSGLFYEAIRIMKEMRENDLRSGRSVEFLRPRYGIYENVPGALSSNDGEDFRLVLEEMCKIKDENANVPRPEDGKWQPCGAIMGNGYSLAWRIHDAQYHGTPQRRRRICVLIDLNGNTAPEMVFELRREAVDGESDKTVADFGTESVPEVQSFGKGLSGYSEQSGAERKGTSTDVAGSVGEAISFQERAGKPGGGKGLLIQEEKTGALACHPQSVCLNPWDVQSKHIQTEDGVAEALYSGECRYGGGESYVMQEKNACVLNDQGGDVMNVSDKAGTLRAQDHGHPPVVFGISPYDSNAMKSANPNSGFYRADTARTLDLNGASPVCNQGGMAVVEPIPQGADLYNQELTGDIAATMNASSCGSPTHSGPSVITYRKQSHPRNSEEPQGWEQTDKNDTLNVHDNSEVRTPTLVVYDARGNGNGQTVPTITGDHENRVTDYSALAVQEDHYMTQQALGEYKECGKASAVTQMAYKEAKDLVVKCIGNGQVHDAQNPEDVCKTLNCMADPMKIVMSDAKCIGNGQVDQAGLHEKVGALNCMHDQQAVLCFSDVAATRVARDGRSGFHTQAIDHPEENVVVGVDMYNQSLTGDQSKPLTAIATDSDHVPCLRTRDYNGVGTVVRRLTPLECTRLQNFPDGWVDIGDWVDSKGKLHKDADSPKYKALGNSIALCWWQWLAYNVAAELKSSGAEMKLASLFDGIGGFPLVFQNAGVEPVWASEIEEFPMAVTKIRFPEREVDGND